MKNESQQIAMYVALGAAITMLVLYFSGQLKFVEYLEGEEAETDEEGDSDEEGMDGEPLPMGESDSESDSESDDEDDEEE